MRGYLWPRTGTGSRCSKHRRLDKSTLTFNSPESFELSPSYTFTLQTAELCSCACFPLQSLKECADEIDLGTQYHLARYAFLYESTVLSDGATLSPISIEDGTLPSYTKRGAY